MEVYDCEISTMRTYRPHFRLGKTEQWAFSIFSLTKCTEAITARPYKVATLADESTKKVSGVTVHIIWAWMLFPVLLSLIALTAAQVSPLTGPTTRRGDLCETVLGYDNPGSHCETTVTIDNYFYPSPFIRGQPTQFEPGHVTDACTILWNCTEYSHIIWNLRCGSRNYRGVVLVASRPANPSPSPPNDSNNNGTCDSVTGSCRPGAEPQSSELFTDRCRTASLPDGVIQRWLADDQSLICSDFQRYACAKYNADPLASRSGIYAGSALNDYLEELRDQVVARAHGPRPDDPGTDPLWLTHALCVEALDIGGNFLPAGDVIAHYLQTIGATYQGRRSVSRVLGALAREGLGMIALHIQPSARAFADGSKHGAHAVPAPSWFHASEATTHSPAYLAFVRAAAAAVGADAALFLAVERHLLRSVRPAVAFAPFAVYADTDVAAEDLIGDLAAAQARFGPWFPVMDYLEERVAPESPALARAVGSFAWWMRDSNYYALAFGNSTLGDAHWLSFLRVSVVMRIQFYAFRLRSALASFSSGASATSGTSFGLPVGGIGCTTPDGPYPYSFADDAPVGDWTAAMDRRIRETGDSIFEELRRDTASSPQSIQCARFMAFASMTPPSGVLVTPVNPPPFEPILGRDIARVLADDDFAELLRGLRDALVISGKLLLTERGNRYFSDRLVREDIAKHDAIQWSLADTVRVDSPLATFNATPGFVYAYLRSSLEAERQAWIHALENSWRIDQFYLYTSLADAVPNALAQIGLRVAMLHGVRSAAMFDPRWRLPAHLATTVWLLAHEMGHHIALGPLARAVHPDGALFNRTVSSGDTAAYAEIERCFADEYSVTTRAGVVQDGARVRDEAMADHVAFLASLVLLSEHSPDNDVASKLQEYFLTFAQRNCFPDDPVAQAALHASTPHPLPESRVNTALKIGRVHEAFLAAYPQCVGRTEKSSCVYLD